MRANRATEMFGVTQIAKERSGEKRISHNRRGRVEAWQRERAGLH